HREAKRHVTIAQARQVIAALPPFVTPVALFVDAPTQEIVDTARELGVRHVQLHGHELPDEIAPLAPLCVIKAVRVTRMGLRDDVRRWRGVADNLIGIVLETASPKGRGRTGVAHDWAFIEAATKAGDLKGLPNIIAAGGLTPETVADVVRRIQ